MMHEHYILYSYFEHTQSRLTMGDMFILYLIRKEEVVVNLDAFVQLW
jgi:hypothetical protein